MKRRGFFKTLALVAGAAATGRLQLAKTRARVWFISEPRYAFKSWDGPRDMIFFKRDMLDKHPLRFEWKDFS